MLRQLWVDQLHLDAFILRHRDMVDEFKVTDSSRLRIRHGNALREGVCGGLLVESTLGGFLLTWMVGDLDGGVQPVI